MRNEKQIKEMNDFIHYFNDSHFLNPQYRDGVIDAFEFVLYTWETRLTKFKDGFNTKSAETDLPSSTQGR